MEKLLGAALAALITLGGCQSQTASVASGDTAQTALDWAGSYSGTLPCADCEGIKTSLNLAQGDTYVLKEEYLGKGGKPFTTKGTFTWDGAGQMITLDAAADGRRFKVGEGRIWQLDLDGGVITGAMADLYILTKQP
ncbi:MAG TPA: copper resistance protein NlpE [Paracoccaceae bacterium]|nr:copper resistance protein NlpE [Paracoccaceae bacterium]